MLSLHWNHKSVFERVSNFARPSLAKQEWDHRGALKEMVTTQIPRATPRLIFKWYDWRMRISWFHLRSHVTSREEYWFFCARQNSSCQLAFNRFLFTCQWTGECVEGWTIEGRRVLSRQGHASPCGLIAVATLSRVTARWWNLVRHWFRANNNEILAIVRAGNRFYWTAAQASSVDEAFWQQKRKTEGGSKVS